MVDAEDTRTSNPGIPPATHVKILAIVAIVGGASILLGGLFVGLGVGLGALAGTVWMGPWGWLLPGVVGSVVGLILAVALLISGVSIAGGVGLLLEAEWGRVLTLIVAVGVGVFAVATLTFLPLAYALYALWVLTMDAVVEGFKRPASEGEFSDEASRLDPP